MGQLVQERYAQSLIEFAIENGIQDEISHQLTILLEIINENKDYQIILSSPVISKMQKNELLDNVFLGKIQQSLLNFLKILADNRRFNLFQDIVAEYIKMLDEYNEVLMVTVKTVIEIDHEMKNRLKNKIEKATKRKVRIETKLDKSLIGGVMIEYNNTQIDASLNNDFIKLGDKIKKATF